MALDAAADLRALGHRDVVVLRGGLGGWEAAGFPLSQGHSVPSKDFGELVQECERIPTVSPDQLRAMIDAGEKIELVDVRTPEEYSRETVPGARNFPGFELPLRLAAFDDDATVVVHCGGRTRSIIGAATLRYGGREGVIELENGTMGWKLAGHELEHGTQSDDMDAVVPQGAELAPKWRTLAASVGVTALSPERARAVMDDAAGRSATVYLFDVRREADYLAGHAAGATWAPSGQLVQLTDTYIGVHNAAVVVMCDDEVRSAIASYWLRRMGHGSVTLVEGGFGAWQEAGLPVEQGWQKRTRHDPGANSIPDISPGALADELASNTPPVVVHVGVSDGFAKAHLPGAAWVSPTWLEPRLDEVAPDRQRRLVITSRSGRRSRATAPKAMRAGWQDVAVLDGGTDAWAKAGFDLESGGPVDVEEPDDVFLHPILRGPEAMRAYLDWEVRLGHKYGANEA